MPIAVDRLIGSNAAGVFVYAKSVANLVSQFVMFSRRSEFGSLLKLLHSRKKTSVYLILSKQIMSLLLVIVSIGMAVTAFFVVNYSNALKYLDVTVLTIGLLALVFLWTIASSLGQVLIVEENTKIYSLVILLTAMMSVLTLMLGMPAIGLKTIFFAEALMFTMQFAAYYYVLTRTEEKDGA